jgi:hypothetical protein
VLPGPLGEVELLILLFDNSGISRHHEARRTGLTRRLDMNSSPYSARKFIRFVPFIVCLIFLATTRDVSFDQTKKSLASAKTVEDAFEKVSDVRLELLPECAISLITDLAVDAEGRYFVADGWQRRGVYIFSREGKFIRELGRRGQGPGEYQTPVSIAVGAQGDIWVADFVGNRISVYDKEWKFRHAILGQPRILYFLHLNSKDEIYMYRSQTNPLKPDTSNTIFRYDRDGRKVSSFAPFPEEALKIKFSAVNDGMDIDKDDFIYEINPLFYRIRKFAPDGTQVASFARTTKLFRIVTKEGATPLIVNGPFCLEKGFIVAQVNKHLEIYDTGGHFVVGEIPFSPRIIESRGNCLYAEASDDDTNQEGNPRILAYRLIR